MEWFLQDNGQPIISEVGARPPGVNIMPMLEAAHEINIWEKWADLMVHSEWSIPERKYAVGCAFLRGQGQGKIITKIPTACTKVRREKFRIETKRNENGTNSKRKRNGTKLGRRVVAEIWGDVWVAVWWRKFCSRYGKWPML